MLRFWVGRRASVPAAFAVIALLTISLLSAQNRGTQQTKPAEQLKYAILLSRHGVRAPTWTTDRLNQYSAAPWPEFGVPPGNLTAHGRTLMVIMGKYYRELFSSRELMGRPSCGDVPRTYFWADTDQRTIETARALAEGMLPGCKAAIQSLPKGETDPLFSPTETSSAKADAKLGVAAVAGRIGPDFTALVDANRDAFNVLNYVLRGDGKATRSIFDEPISLAGGKSGATMSGPLSLASTLSEVFLLEYTNGMKGQDLGWGRLNARNLQQMMSLHTAYADLMRQTPYLAQTRGGNLLHHILRSLEQAVKGAPVKGGLGDAETAVAVIAGHDTNLSNLAGLLRLSWMLPSYQPNDAPPGGAMVFSLWKSSATGRYSVRLQFLSGTLEQMHDASPLTLSSPPAVANLFVPGCSTSSEGYPCDWDEFARIAAQAAGPVLVRQ